MCLGHVICGPDDRNRLKEGEVFFLCRVVVGVDFHVIGTKFHGVVHAVGHGGGEVGGVTIVYGGEVVENIFAPGGGGAESFDVDSGGLVVKVDGVNIDVREVDVDGVGVDGGRESGQE